MNTASSMSAAMQHQLVTDSIIAVSRFCNSYASKIGLKHFFSAEEIQDIAGDVRLDACQYYRNYKPEKSKFSTWVRGIASNCVKDAICAKIKRLPISVRFQQMGKTDSANMDELIKGAEEVLSGLSADARIYLMDLESSIRDVLSKMNNRKQVIYHLTQQEGLKPREIAKIIGCSSKTVSRNLCEIKNALKRSLSDNGLEYEISEAA